MTLQSRILLLVSLLLFLAVAITSGVLSWSARHSILVEAERSAESVAGLLAYSAAFARDVPVEVEALVSEQMVTEATIAAHFVAAAENGGLDAAQIVRILTEIVEATNLDEIVVTDETGYAYLNTVPGVEFTFLSDPQLQPQASAFYPLLTGEATQVVQEARVREIDDKVMKYSGVAGVDKPRIVQVGHEFGYVEELRRRFGLGQLLPHLMQSGGIDAIWVLDDTMDILAHAALPEFEMPDRPPEADTTHIRSVFEQGRTESEFTGNLLKVAAPIIQRDGTVTGAVLVYFPLNHLEATLTRNAQLSVAVSVAVLLLGLFQSIVVGRRLTRPVTEISAAAQAFESQSFDPASLGNTRERQDELGNLARVFTRMAEEVQARTDHLDRLVGERTQALNEKNAELEKTLARIEEELAMAQRMQLSILPRQLPQHPGIAFFARMTAAREVGGDFYDVFDIDEERVGIVIADVSGKGMPAALFMAVSHTVIKSVASRRRPPSQVMARANDILCEGNDAAMFVTVFYGILNTRTGELVYANAGHNSPCLIGAAGQVAPLASTGGVALGVMEGLDYEERTIALGDGDTVFCFTDGITEAFDESGKEFSEAALEEILREDADLSPEALGEKVIDRVHDFAGAAPQSDDITCLVLRRGLSKPAV